MARKGLPHTLGYIDTKACPNRLDLGFVSLYLVGRTDLPDLRFSGSDRFAIQTPMTRQIDTSFSARWDPTPPRVGMPYSVASEITNFTYFTEIGVFQCVLVRHKCHLTRNDLLKPLCNPNLHWI